MTFEELRAEAKLQGYTLIKVKPRVKFEPCLCGCNVRQHYSRWTGQETLVMLRCTKCGREATGKTESDAKLNWNEFIRAEKKLRSENTEWTEKN